MKEKESVSLVQELTALVKEQKSRIAELLKTKRNAVTELKVTESTGHDRRVLEQGKTNP